MAQVAEEAKVEIPEDLQDVLGQRIRVESSIGTIRYVGPVATSKKATTIWLGIEWDDENRGKNDGAVTTPDGTVHRYFTTTDGRGSFIKPVKATFGRDILAAINARFSLETLEDDVKEQQQIAQESNFKIEFVGWDKSIRRQCDLTKKTSVALEDHDVRYIDSSKLKELREIVPKCQQLDLRRNLITSLVTFPGLRSLGDTLRELNLSHNKLDCIQFETIQSMFNDENGFNKVTFPNLCNLFINNTASKVFKPWQFVYLLAINGCLSKLSELQIASNDFANFKLPAHILENKMDGNPNDFESNLSEPDGETMAKIFETLQIVEIGENPLTDWTEIGDVWGYCPNLERLKVNWSELPTIKHKEGQFLNMRRLWARNNKFTDISVVPNWDSIPKHHQFRSN